MDHWPMSHGANVFYYIEPEIAGAGYGDCHKYR